MEKLSKRLVSWASLLDEKTVEQARTSSTMPFIYPHLALMPDAHLGLGATVGSVIPTLGAIIPAAVGVDIGCGMIAVQTQFAASDLPADRRAVREQIERAIPLSAGGTTARSSPPPSRGSRSSRRSPRRRDSTRRRTRATGASSSDRSAAATTSSRSRSTRPTRCGCSCTRAAGAWATRSRSTTSRSRSGWPPQWWIDLPDPDLAYLVEGTPEFTRYIAELRWAQHFALLNREEMMDRVIRQVSEWVGAPVEERERINCHHNFTESEEHFGKRVWVSRKGAIQADVGRLGLIPGSMGTASYVVEGLGHPMSLNSSPHGAGRSFSRSAARRTFTHDQLREAMAGIEFRDTDAFIDEIPQAYKPIDQVMADAASLVTVRHTLRQLVNVKGE